jgi:hypothetical protein
MNIQQFLKQASEAPAITSRYSVAKLRSDANDLADKVREEYLAIGPDTPLIDQIAAAKRRIKAARFVYLSRAIVTHLAAEPSNKVRDMIQIVEDRIPALIPMFNVDDGDFI